MITGRPRSQDSTSLMNSNVDPDPRGVPIDPVKRPLVSLATPHSDVSAFCRAVLTTVIPNDFWGEGSQGQRNRECVMQNVDRFVRLRRFETLSLHAVFQSLKVLFYFSTISGSLTYVDDKHKLARADSR